MKTLLSIILLLSFSAVIGQEICDNGIDDDADGLIDLNDPDCDCNIIPNPSFEDINCCPTASDQINCSNNWVNANLTTADFFHNCNSYQHGGSFNPITPPVGGGYGYVGFKTQTLPPYSEYPGTCLNSPMLAGQQYTIGIYVARGAGPTTLDLAIYGAQNCSDLPWNNYGCPTSTPNWSQLAIQSVSLGSPNSIGTWFYTTLTFTPSSNIEAIAIGGSCSSSTGYYVIDELTLSPNLTTGTISTIGNWCTNNLKLYAQPNTTGGTWQWYKNGVALVGEINDTLNIMPFGDGDYTYLYTNNLGCEQADFNFTAPNLTSSFSALNQCFGTPISFINNSTITNDFINNISWDFGDNIGTSNYSNPSYLYTNPGIYTVTLIQTSNTGCTDTSSLTIEVFPLPIPNFIANNICFGDTTIFTNTTSTQPNQYLSWNWDFNGDLIIDDYSQNPSHSFTGPGIFPVNLNATDLNGCINDTTILVTINPIPTFNLGNDTTLCPDDTLTLGSTIANATYLWQDNSTPPYFDVSQTGDYWITVTVDNCSSIDSINVTYNPNPEVNIGNDTTGCVGESLMLESTIINATYLWQDNSTTPHYNVNQTGNYWVKVTVGNCSSTDSINITYTPVPSVNIGNDTTLCVGENLMLEPAILNATYLWHDNSTTPNYNVVQAGEYWVTATVNNCSSSDTINVNYNSLINLGNDTTVCIDDIFILDATTDNSLYLWQDNTTLPTKHITHPGTYWVDISSACGVYSDSITVNFKDCSITLYTPNTFTPNNDNLNDVFAPIIDGNLFDYTFKIFNRWGEIIFETNNPNNSWNGSYNNKVSPIGVYIYLITYKSKDMIETKLRGKVHLIR